MPCVLCWHSVEFSQFNIDSSLPAKSKELHIINVRRNLSIAKLSDSEIMTISICGELIGIDSENSWYSFVKRNYHHLFPNLCNRSRFNRTRRSLLQTTELIRQKLISVFNIPLNKYFIVDSFPFEVCKFGRARYSRCFRAYGAVW